MSMQNSLFFDVGVDMSAFNKGIEGAVTRVAGLGKVAVAAGLSAFAAGIGLVAKGAIDASAQMEVFGLRLETLMGSSSGAKDRLAELADFAASTPFELDGIVGAEVTLRGFGAAAEELMPGLIDFAATTGAELSQSAIDIGKAWNQGAVGLESDTAKILRKQVELRLGTDATKVSIDEFRGALLSVLDDGMFAGGADRLSRTFTGMVSTLHDEWSGFLRDVGTTSQLFEGVKATLAGILTAIQQNREEIRVFASIVGEKLWTGFKFTAMAAAGMADAIRSGYGFANLLAAGMDSVASAIHRAAAAESTFEAAIARVAGKDKLAGQLAGMAGFSRQMQMASEARARGELDVARAITEDVNPASRAMLDILTQAEAAAGGTADEIARATSKAADGGSAGKGKAPKEDTSQLDAINAWVDYYNTLDRMRADDFQRAEQWRVDELARARELTDAMGGDYESFAQLKDKIDEEYYAKLQDMSDAYEQKRREEAQRTSDEQARINQAAAISLVEVTANTLSTIASIMDQSNKEAKAAYQVLAIAQVVIASAVATIRAFADLGPIAGAVAAAGIVIGAGASIATIASAHQGYAGPVSSARADQPDEVTTRKLKTEAVLSSQATRALGADGIAALERGGGGGAVSVNLRIGRVAQREIIRTDMRTGGALARGLSRAGRSSDIAPGMSGLAAA